MLEISDENIRLRPYQNQDVAELVRAARESVGTVGLWLPWCHNEYSEDDAKSWINNCQINIENDIAYDIAIFSVKEGILIGGISINQIDKRNKIGNIGYWIRKTYQNRGYATGAVKLIKEIGFNTLKLNRLEIVILENNIGSRRVAEKSGATFECIARNRLVHNGKAMPAAVYSLIP